MIIGDCVMYQMANSERYLQARARRQEGVQGNELEVARGCRGLAHRYF